MIFLFIISSLRISIIEIIIPDETFVLPNYTCDIEHTTLNNFDINDGLTHCINATGTISNININNGVLINEGNITLNNI